MFSAILAHSLQLCNNAKAYNFSKGLKTDDSWRISCFSSSAGRVTSIFRSLQWNVPLPQYCKRLHTVQDCFCRRQVVLWVLVVLVVHWVRRGTVTLQQCSIVVRAVLDTAMQISGVLWVLWVFEELPQRKVVSTEFCALVGMVFACSGLSAHTGSLHVHWVPNNFTIRGCDGCWTLYTVQCTLHGTECTCRLGEDGLGPEQCTECVAPQCIEMGAAVQ